jgi:hypothetical protein
MNARQPRNKPKTCCVGDCGRTSASHINGDPYCAKHAQRMRLYGRPIAPRDEVRPRGLAAIADAVANRDRSSCWTDWDTLPCWTDLNGYGGTISRGYPTIGPDKVMWFVMEADGRPRPAAPANHGLHSCDNTRCWNPAHLRWGTHGQNMQDLQQSRNYCVHCPHCNTGS